jgi:hypothetical protein
VFVQTQFDVPKSRVPIFEAAEKFITAPPVLVTVTFGVTNEVPNTAVIEPEPVPPRNNTWQLNKAFNVIDFAVTVEFVTEIELILLVKFVEVVTVTNVPVPVKYKSVIVIVLVFAFEVDIDEQ